MTKTIESGKTSTRLFTGSRVLFAFVTILAFTPAEAGYDKTHWGMALDQVQKQYPGGGARPDPTNKEDITYQVARDVAGHKAKVLFVFKPKRGLAAVVVAFLPSGTAPVAHPAFPDMMSFQEADDVRQSITRNLELKYGSPWVKDATSANWRTKAGDCIRLQIDQAQPMSAGTTAVGLLTVTYASCDADSTGGL